jgi:hypothetical protein
VIERDTQIPESFCHFSKDCRTEAETKLSARPNQLAELFGAIAAFLYYCQINHNTDERGQIWRRVMDTVEFDCL